MDLSRQVAAAIPGPDRPDRRQRHKVGTSRIQAGRLLQAVRSQV